MLIERVRLEAAKLQPSLSRERKARLIAPIIDRSEARTLKLLRQAEKLSR